jgi:glycosyltransferase involved in cell wall biosynthesis
VSRPAAPAREEAPEQLARGAQGACEVTIVAHDIGPVRGMERQLSDLVMGLERRGHRVTVIARTCDLPGSRVRFHRVRGPSRPFVIAYPWFMLAGSLAMRRWRRGVVQATGALVLGRVDVIAVHYCHQVATPTPSRSSWPFRLQVKLAGALKRWGERLCYRPSRASSFVCVSEGVAEEIRSQYPAIAERTLTIHNGIDVDTFAPGRHLARAREMRRELAIEDGRLLAAFVGSEWERKGLRPAIEALAAAREWDLLVAGGGDERAYRELAESLGVDEAVHWLGVTREIPAVYELADALVMPSSYETFSLVTFEAAASGLAIVATAVNGVRELIEDGRNGLLIEPRHEQIAANLQALADPELRDRLGRAARESALAFSRENMVVRHSELYGRLAARAAGPC